MSGGLSGPGVTARGAAHRGMTEGRESAVHPTSVTVIFPLASSVLTVLYRCEVNDKWVPLHIRSGRRNVYVT